MSIKSSVDCKIKACNQLMHTTPDLRVHVFFATVRVLKDPRNDGFPWNDEK